MNGLHCFMRATLVSPLGPESEIWVNVSQVTSIMQDTSGGSHVLMGGTNTSLQVKETPTEMMSTATYLTPGTKKTEPVYFGEEN